MTSSYPSDRADPVGNFVAGIAIELERLGHTICVVAPRYGKRSYAAPETQSMNRLHIFRFTFERSFSSNLLYMTGVLGLIRLMSYTIQGLIATLRIARKFDVDIIHAHWVIPSGLVALIVGKMLAKPVIISSYGSDLRIAPRRILLRTIVSIILREVDYFVAICKDLRVNAICLGADPARTAVIPDGVRRDLFTSHPKDDPTKMRERWKLGTRDVIVYIGRLDRLKGLSHLIEAMVIMSKTLPNAILVIGGDGPERAFLERLAIERGVSESIRFVGPIPHDRVPSVLSLASVCVLPSLSEGLPSFLEEAFLAGRPVVATNVGGIPDLIVPGDTGLLVAPSDPSALAEAIRTITTDYDLARKLGNNAKQFAEANLTTDITAARISRLYEETIRMHRTGRKCEECYL